MLGTNNRALTQGRIQKSLSGNNRILACSVDIRSRSGLYIRSTTRVSRTASQLQYLAHQEVQARQHRSWLREKNHRRMKELSEHWPSAQIRNLKYSRTNTEQIRNKRGLFAPFIPYLPRGRSQKLRTAQNTSAADALSKTAYRGTIYCELVQSKSLKI